MTEYEQLYEDNKKLLYRCAYRQAGALARDHALSIEDLAQAGFFGLVEAQKAYNPQRGKSWVKFASWFIYRELRTLTHYYRGKVHSLNQGAISLDTPIGEDTDGDTLVDMIPDNSLPDPCESMYRQTLRTEVRRAVDALPTDFQRAVIREVYYNGHTRKEAGAILGATTSQLTIAETQIRNRFRRDAKLIQLAQIDDLTRFHKHKGVAAFTRDLTSVTEGEALRRIEIEEQMGLYHPQAQTLRGNEDAEPGL